MGSSSRHHYIPEFFQNGFGDAEGKLVIYDKLKDQFLTNQTPANWFLIKNLNSVFRDGKVAHALEEKLLAGVDGDHGAVIRKFREIGTTKVGDVFTADEWLNLLHFALVLFWRSPASDESLMGVYDRLGIESDFFPFHDVLHDVINKEEVAKNIRHYLLDEESRKIARFLVPFSHGIGRELKFQIGNFKLYTSDNAKGWNFLLGDCPVVTQEAEAGSKRLFNALLLPISKNRLLLVAEGAPSFLDQTLAMQVNVNLIHQSNRFVAGSSLGVLAVMVDKYKSMIELGHANALHPALFKHIRWQGSFDNYDDFDQAYKLILG